MSNLQDKFISYIAKTSGRDKLMRVIQFFFRFIKGILLKTRDRLGQPKKFEEFIKKLDIISSTFSMTRRLLRFGRTLQYQVNLWKLIKSYQQRNHKDPFDKYNYLWGYVVPHGVSDFLTIAQFYFDHYLYLHKLKIFDNPEAYKFLNLICDWGWFSDILLCIYYCFFEIWLLKKKISAIDSPKETKCTENNEEKSEKKKSKEEVKSLEKKISGLKLDIAKLSFDLPVSYYYIDDHFSHIVWIGLTGTISSAIGAYQAW